MRISGTRVDRALQQRTYPVDRPSHPPAAERTGLQATAAYSVTLSATAREVALARRAIAESPDVRAQRVAAVKFSIESGTYAPSSHAIAQKIMAAIGLGAGPPP